MIMTEQRNFDCTCIGDLHSWLLHEGSGTVGKTLNAFDTTINIRTAKDELLVITLGKLRSPMNLNVNPGNANVNLGFKQIVGEDAKARILNENVGKRPRAALLVGDAVIMLSEHDKFRNHFSCLEPRAIQTFARNSDRIFSALESQAHANRFGCLLEPDVTTRGLLDAFLVQLIKDKTVLDYHEFKARISKELLELCGKGPGFTPAGDDFIAGYLTMFNWLCGSLKLGQAIIPGSEFSLQTTWTSFKLIEYSARNLLDEQVQEMINSVARNQIDDYVRSIELISKRGHTSGVDFVTGMTFAMYTITDRLHRTRVLENISRVLNST